VKQCNVCRNVSTIYREKAKALDSYKLLLASIDSEDKATRDQLTIELAKAIYQNLNSGYVSDISGQKMNSGIYELTKNIVHQSAG